MGLNFNVKVWPSKITWNLLMDKQLIISNNSWRTELCWPNQNCCVCLMGLPKGTRCGWDVIVLGAVRTDKQTQYPAPRVWISEPASSYRNFSSASILSCIHQILQPLCWFVAHWSQGIRWVDYLFISKGIIKVGNGMRVGRNKEKQRKKRKW